MCGVAGLLDFKKQFGPESLRRIGQRMAASLHHRGPDGQGTWIDAAGVVFGHTRLAIIDLSPAGAQPMISSCGKFVLIYNGEIYNAPELRAELQALGRKFRGHSDTEVIIEGFSVWGVRQTVERMIGMFAFATWDRSTRTLTLGRDRLGVKPLYWGWTNNCLIFASELRALKNVPNWVGEIDRNALAAFLRYGYVPKPMSIYRGISKLEPGRLLQCNLNGEAEQITYWSLADVAARGQSSLLDVSDAEAERILETLLGDAVRRQMVADVPIGLLLSGGIDSATVAAFMQSISNRPIRTFSIGFHELGYDEAAQAKEVAARLGTEHTELYVAALDARAVIPKLQEIYDEPFADSSQIPTFLVSEMTRRHVTVALSGDGGDEVFAGYSRYGQGLAILKIIRMLPGPLRLGIARAMTGIAPGTWDSISRMVLGPNRSRMAGDRIHKLAGLIARDAVGFYRRLVSQWPEASTLVRDAAVPDEDLYENSIRELFTDDVSWMQYIDTLTYLPDDILTKVDRASMAVALELRVPLLDHRVVELSWRLPQQFKLRGGTSKWLLRQILYKHLPKHLLQRPKTGFAIPVDQWLRGPLKDWASDLLNSSATDGAGLLDRAPILEKWTEHQTGARNWHYFLWNVLMFEAWSASNRSH